MPLYQCKVINDLGKKATVFRQASDEVSLKAYLNWLQKKNPICSLLFRAKQKRKKSLPFLDNLRL